MHQFKKSHQKYLIPQNSILNCIEDMNSHGFSKVIFERRLKENCKIMQRWTMQSRFDRLSLHTLENCCIMYFLSLVINAELLHQGLYHTLEWTKMWISQHWVTVITSKGGAHNLYSESPQAIFSNLSKLRMIY